MLYQGVINRIKQSPIGRRRLRSITSDMLQTYMDSLCFLSTGYVRVYQAVLQGAFRYAVFPGKFLAHNPMQYVTRKEKRQEPALFESEETVREVVTHAQFLTLCRELEGRPALLPVQISYYTGLRLGEACALTWQDIDLREQCLTVRRSIRYNGAIHCTELSTTKRGKVRTVAFGDTLLLSHYIPKGPPSLCSQPPFAGGAAAGGCGPFRFCLPERGRVVYIAGPGGENL